MEEVVIKLSMRYEVKIIISRPLMMLNERESGLEIEKLYLFRLSDLSAVIDTYSDNRI